MRDVPRDTGFVEVADRVWVSRRSWYDVNVTAIGGERGLLVVDTHASDVAGRAVLADLAALGAGEPVAVVNTHAHHDHTFGNGAFRAAYPDVPLIAHEAAAAELDVLLASPPDDVEPDADVAVPDTTFSSVHVVDLGDRGVELVHPGPAHTGGDLVVLVGDADVAVVGDLVEESGTPAYGADSHPLGWPVALDLVIGLLGPETLVVPGHGACVGKEFVEDQRASIGIVAETARDLAGRGVPVDEALAAAQWPYPAERLEQAVRRVYAAVPRAPRQLPLV